MTIYSVLRAEDVGLDTLAELLLIKLGANISTPATSFGFFTARHVAEAVRGLTLTTECDLQEPVPPLAKAILYKQCRRLADGLGGEIAFSFELTGLYDELLAGAQLVLQPLAPHPAKTPSPRRGAKTKRKFNGIFQQGGDRAEDEFDLMSDLDRAEALWRYEIKVLGGEIPRASQPAPAQMSAVRAQA